MPLICYESKKFNSEHEEIIVRANEIIVTYQDQGYDLTLRQLYYQFVSRDWFPESWADATTGSTNNERSYKKLGSIISDARRAGRIDWESIVDRTRNVHIPPSWDGPSDIVKACARSFDVDWWDKQPYRPEVWVEKDALIGVMEVACRPWHCSYFSCRGYTSDSEIWGAAQRLDDHASSGQVPLIIHLGDHDPSGIDMSRDIEKRLNLFSQGDCAIEVRRIALNMDQIQQYRPPPNPAKSTDTRYSGYRTRFGNESWELDALNPEILTNLIAGVMEEILDQEAWDEAEQERDSGRRKLSQVSKNWDEITKDY